MSDIKVGDRVAVYSYKGRFTGVVTATSKKYQDILYVTQDGFYSGHDDNPFHRKQCQKLVKTVECRICEGKGFTNWHTTSDRGRDIYIRVICERCDGKGKIKL